MPVFDQGYQHWSGTLSGHAWRWVTITRHGVRVGMKNVLLRLLIIVSWLPAAGLAFLLCLWGLLENRSSLVAGLRPFLAGIFPPDALADPRHFRVEYWTLCFHYFLQIELSFAMIVVLLVGPGLISQDLRFNALPLYLSRPLRRGDYFAGKLGVIGWFLCLVVVLPSLIAYVLGVLFSLSFSTVWDTFPLLLSCLAYGAIIVLSAGTLMLALSSLSRNSRYVALFWVALWFVSSIVGTILEGVAWQQRQMAHQRKLAEEFSGRHRPQRPLTPHEQRDWQEYSARAQQLYWAEELRASQSNWRPLVSYTANLSRLGQQLLNTDAAFLALSRREPAQLRDQFLVVAQGPQYPWYWSAAVLAALMGLSAWILHRRVRSLDRLK
jgi:ABC-2 type transport system permease protein